MSQKHVQKLTAVLALIIFGLAATAHRVPAASKTNFINTVRKNTAFQSMSSAHQ